MAEQYAVAKIVRSGGEAARVLAGLNRESQEALRYLERLNPDVAKASRTWEALHEQIRRGEQLPADTMRRYDEMGNAIRQRASEAARILPGRPLTLDERQAREQRGRYSAAELDRALMTPSGAVLVPRLGAYGSVDRSRELQLRRLRGDRDALARDLYNQVAASPEEHRDRARAEAMNSPRGETLRQLTERISGLEGSSVPPLPTPPRPQLPPASRPTTPHAPIPARLPSPETDLPPAARDELPSPPSGPRVSDPAYVASLRMLSPAELAKRRRQLEAEIKSLSPRFGQGDAGGMETLDPKLLAKITEQAPEIGQTLAQLEAVRAEEKTRKLDEQSRAQDKLTEATQRSTTANRIRNMGDVQLGTQWVKLQDSLSGQHQEIQRLEKGLERLHERKRAGLDVDDQVIRQTTDQVAAVRTAREETLRTEKLIAAEGRKRGFTMPVRGASLLPGTTDVTSRQLLTAFAGGAGFGGGGLPGMIGGLATGLPVPLALAAGVGLAVGAAWQFATRSMETAEEAQKRIFETGMRLGGGFTGLRARSTEGLRSPLLLQFDETLGATVALATQTGNTDVGAIAAFARAYGLPVQQTAAILGQYGALGRAPQRTVRRVTEDLPPLAEHLRPGHTLVPPPMPEQAYVFSEGAAARAAVARARIGAGLHPYKEQPLRRTRTITSGRDLANIIAGAYEASAYASLPEDRRNALSSAFLQQVGQLYHLQATGGAPIENFDVAPAMLAVATRHFGPDVNPAFAAQAAGGFVSSITQPSSEMARGIALRSVMQLARTMSPERLAGLRAKGYDLTRYTGARAAVENAFSLPDGASGEVVRAILGGFRGFTGTGTEAERMFLTQATGGKMAPAIAISELADKLVNAKAGSVEEGALIERFRGTTEAAGTEGQPFINAARVQQYLTDIGGPLAQLSQGIEQEVLDFADRIRNAQSAWKNGGFGGEQ